jgi:uncharacterized damage-inducible protein DinB
MALTLDDLLDALRRSRAYFLKHVEGLKDEQWDFKPFPECKSVRETLQHLIIDDRAAVDSIRTGEDPNYEEGPYSIKDLSQLKQTLTDSHEALLQELRIRYANAPIDSEICVWGAQDKLGTGIAYFSSEDFYHAGQVAFLRMASDPEWDYYAAIYGGE